MQALDLAVRNFAVAKIDEAMKILTVRSFWADVETHTGFQQAHIRSSLSDLIQRRNDIAHRADRPPESTSSEQRDPHGLKPINHAWVSARVAIAKAFVDAAANCVGAAVQQLEAIVAQKEEQAIAQQTLNTPNP